MTATVEQLQSEWAHLIELAQQGEEVVLTSHGQAVARLTAIPRSGSIPERGGWLAELALLRDETATGKTSPSTEEILEDLRSDRGS